MVLKIDEQRLAFAVENQINTGVFVRAWDKNNVIHTVDVFTLDRESIKTFLRSYGGKNEFAENLCGFLLGYEKILFEPEGGKNEVPND